MWTASVLAQGTSNKDDSRNCFFPNGIQSSGSPCFPDQAVSPCCGPSFICLSNGLCQPGPDTRRTYHYTVYRSSCTDRTWNSTDCPRICLGSDDNLDSGQGLATCGTGGSYCCGRGYDCCSNATDIFNYGTAEVVTTIPVESSTISTASSTISSVTSASPPSKSSSSSSSSSATAIGVGVGVGVGGFAVLLASILLFLLFRRRRKQEGKQNHRQSGPNDVEGNQRCGSELPTHEMKHQGAGPENGGMPPLPTYHSSNLHNDVNSPSGDGGGDMVPGAPLNPAEFPSGPERERFEMDGEQHETWKDASLRRDRQRHELE
ncbi:hypothetical protein MPH_10560 [Macrophomina phaseolina MS6]|uniref:Uncharacterized protein n=2 Tax=Macrophomina phaseolina TaxID=35725 RepID=K2S694_MACPH|nr:hypothetical protein MPH_10560 [Macrophomina phaseolina MS6]